MTRGGEGATRGGGDRSSRTRSGWIAILLVLFTATLRAQYSAQDYYNAAIGLMAQNNWTQAGAYLEAALKLEPGNVSAWKRLGECQEKQGQYRAAQLSYEKALSLAPTDGEAQSRLDSVRVQAAQSISKETGLAGAGEEKKPKPKPGLSFTAGPGLDILSRGDLSEHINTTYFMFHSGVFLPNPPYLFRYNPYAGLLYAPSWSLKYLTSVGSGSSSAPVLGYHFRVQGAHRVRLSDGFYLQLSASAQYQAVERAGYEVAFNGEVSDDSGLFTAKSSSSKPITMTESWRGSAAVLALGPSLGLQEEESGKLLNHGSLGLEFLIGSGWLGYRSDLDSASGSSTQTASVHGLGIGLGTRVELVKKILGVPFNLDLGYRWLSIHPLTGTLTTSDHFGTKSRDESYDVTAVDVPYSYTDTGANFFNYGQVARFATGTVPDGVPLFALDLGGFNLALSVRLGF